MTSTKMATPSGCLKVLLVILLFLDNVLCDDDDYEDPGSRSGEEDTCDDLKPLLTRCCRKRHTYGPTQVCATTCHTSSGTSSSCWTAVFYDECHFTDQMLIAKCQYYSGVNFNLYYKHPYGYSYPGCRGYYVASYKHMLDCYPYTGIGGMDIRKPVIYNVPRDDIITTTDPGKPTAEVYWNPEPYARDYSGIVTLTSNMSPGDEFPIGDTRVTYRAIDGAGNIAFDSFKVSVIDKEKPVITSGLSVIHREVEPGETAKVVYWSVPTIYDNSGSTPTVITNTHPGDAFPIGITRVTYTATDASHNSDVFSFTILIIKTDRTPHPSPSRPVCKCEVSSGNICQLSAENTTTQSMINCQNATLHSLKFNCQRCQKPPPSFPDCSFPQNSFERKLKQSKR